MDSSSYFVGRAFTRAAGATFTVRRPTLKYYTLQNDATSQYATADNYGNGAILVTRPWPSTPGWETFSFIQQGNTYAIQV